VDPESQKFSAKQSVTGAWQKTTRQALNTEQADRLKHRAGEHLNRSVELADRGRPRECQYSPRLL